MDAGGWMEVRRKGLPPVFKSFTREQLKKKTTLSLMMKQLLMAERQN
jgi:hypothetical protein